MRQSQYVKAGRRKGTPGYTTLWRGLGGVGSFLIEVYTVLVGCQSSLAIITKGHRFKQLKATQSLRCLMLSLTVEPHK